MSWIVRARCRRAPGAAVEPGEILVREGDTDDSVFEVVDGAFEILRGEELERIDTVGPGETLGEIAAIARARAPPRCGRWSRPSSGGSIDGGTTSGSRTTTSAGAADRARPRRIDRHRTIAMISELLGVDRTVAADVVESSEWVRLEAGDVLFAEGDDSDAGYLVVSGRLTVSRDWSHVGEVARGEVVGEIGLIERTAARRPWSRCARGPWPVSASMPSAASSRPTRR